MLSFLSKEQYYKAMRAKAIFSYPRQSALVLRYTIIISLVYLVLLSTFQSVPLVEAYFKLTRPLTDYIGSYILNLPAHLAIVREETPNRLLYVDHIIPATMIAALVSLIAQLIVIKPLVSVHSKIIEHERKTADLKNNIYRSSVSMVFLVFMMLLGGYYIYFGSLRTTPLAVFVHPATSDLPILCAFVVGPLAACGVANLIASVIARFLIKEK